MVVVLIDDNDLDIFSGVKAPQAVRAEGASGATAEHHDSLGHNPIVGYHRAEE
jgi:hypothetical protein